MFVLFSEKYPLIAIRKFIVKYKSVQNYLLNSKILRVKNIAFPDHSGIIQQHLTRLFFP